MDLIKNKEIDLVVNTPTKANDSKRDGFHIRRAAIERNIGVMTSLDTLEALVELQKEGAHNRELEVFNLI